MAFSSNFNDGLQENPLDRPVISWRDADIRNLEFTYLTQYFTDRGNTSLSLTGEGTSTTTGGAPSGNLTPGTLGNLAPAAGGDLGSLSPSAGGNENAPNLPFANCTNAYLASEFDLPPGQRTCQVGGGATPPAQ